MKTEINVDNSLLGDWKKCKAMAIVKHVFGLVGKAEKIAADIGNAYHDGLELHFRGKGKRAVSAAFERAYDLIIPPGEAPKEERFARPNCVKIMERYVETMPVEQFPFEPVSFEEVKGCALDDKKEIIFWVKRDMTGKDKKTGAISPIDHKTTGNMTVWWAKKYRLTSQMSGYCWFTGREFGVPVGLCYINGLEIKKLPDSNRRCPVHGMPYHKCSGEHVNFQLYRYERSQEMLDKWLQDAIALAREFRTFAKAFGDISLLPYVPRDGAFNDGCIFCEVKEWCLRGFAPEWQDEFTVYARWAPWSMPGAKRIDV